MTIIRDIPEEEVYLLSSTSFDIKGEIIKTNFFPQALADIIVSYIQDFSEDDLIHLDHWFNKMRRHVDTTFFIDLLMLLPFTGLHFMVNLIIPLQERENSQPYKDILLSGWALTFIFPVLISILRGNIEPQNLPKLLDKNNPNLFKKTLSENTELAKQYLESIKIPSITFQLLYSLSFLSATLTLVGGIAATVYLPDQKTLTTFGVIASSGCMISTAINLSRSCFFRHENKQDRVILAAANPDYSSLSK